MNPFKLTIKDLRKACAACRKNKSTSFTFTEYVNQFKTMGVTIADEKPTMLITIKGLHSSDSDRLLIPFKKAGWDWDTDDYFGQIKLIKDCQSYAQAIHEFEKISGYTVLDTDHNGADIFWFVCEENREVFSGWGALKHVYQRWYDTPRKCLEALNREDTK